MNIPRRPRLWPWFAGGFAAAFMGLLAFYPVVAVRPSGPVAVRQPLWAFYADALPRLFGPSALGPASGNSGALATVVLEHAVLAAAAGVVGLLVGRGLRGNGSADAAKLV